MYTSCATFHKQVFIEIGLFDTEIRSGQDTDMWIRIGQIYPIVFSFKILARYVYDQESLSKNNAYLHQKLDFSKFTAAEKNNPALKKFLDFNRFSLAIKCKLNSDYAKYGDYVSAIDCNKLPLKKRILLQLPAVVLKQLLFFNDLMLTLGIRKTIFK